jgi:hypothetical protein
MANRFEEEMATRLADAIGGEPGIAIPSDPDEDAVGTMYFEVYDNNGRRFVVTVREDR